VPTSAPAGRSPLDRGLFQKICRQLLIPDFVRIEFQLSTASACPVPSRNTPCSVSVFFPFFPPYIRRTAEITPASSGNLLQLPKSILQQMSSFPCRLFYSPLAISSYSPTRAAAITSDAFLRSAGYKSCAILYTRRTHVAVRAQSNINLMSFSRPTRPRLDSGNAPASNFRSLSESVSRPTKIPAKQKSPPLSAIGSPRVTF